MKITYKKYIFITTTIFIGIFSLFFSSKIHMIYDTFAFISYRSISYFKKIESAWTNFFHLDYEEIKKKYELTAKKLESLQHRCHELSYLEHSKEILKKRLPGNALYNWYCLPATILASINNDIEQILFIDRGAHNYIQMGLPVIYNNMLIGKIKTINHWFSEVITITNTQSKIAVTFDKTTIHGIAQGSGNNNCLQVLYVENSPILKKGQAVYTSGDGLLFPPGLLIGHINEIFTDGGLYATVTITPALIPEVNDMCQIITYDSIHKDCITIENILKKDHSAVSIDPNNIHNQPVIEIIPEKKIIPPPTKKEKLPEKEKIDDNIIHPSKKSEKIKEEPEKEEKIEIIEKKEPTTIAPQKPHLEDDTEVKSIEKPIEEALVITEIIPEIIHTATPENDSEEQTTEVASSPESEN